MYKEREAVIREEVIREEVIRKVEVQGKINGLQENRSGYKKRGY